MQREMEQTRTELRKGILELPQETAESAAQMRRVIVEQIDALAELNRIVARHGGGATAEPRTPSGASSGSRHGTRRAARARRRGWWPRQSAAAAACRAAGSSCCAGRWAEWLADGPAGPRLARGGR